MAILSELLRFRHYDCSRGSTVERPFLDDLLSHLGYQGPRLPNKDVVLLECIRLATGDPTSRDDLLSSGETVTDDALQAVIDGVLTNGLSDVSLTEGAPAARVAMARSQIDPDVDAFSPLDLSDERKTSLRAIKVRSGQGTFREKVLRAYGTRCAISNCDVSEALEAAHITPYRGTRSNVVANGICLRADLHRLWDTGRLAVHESTHEVLLDAEMVGTDYSFYVGDRIRLPVDAGDAPSSLALEQQRLWAGFSD